MNKSVHFAFDGNAGSYLGIGVLVWLLTFFTCGLGYPWALCMLQRWKVQHTSIDGKRLQFTGSGGGLVGLWIKWLLLCCLTCGIYSLWVIPDLHRWVVEHTDFENA